MRGWGFICGLTGFYKKDSMMKKYTIPSRTSWRTRFRIPALRRANADALVQDLGRLPGVDQVILRRRSVSIILIHRGQTGVPSEAFQRIEAWLTPGRVQRPGEKPASHVSGKTLALTAGIGACRLMGLPVVSGPVIIAVATIWLAFPVVRDAITTWRETGKPGMGLLSSSVLLAALASGNVLTPFYIFWLFNTASWLETRATRYTRAKIRSLLSGTDPEVWKQVGDVEVAVAVADLQPGDVICLRKGSGVPVDGTVMSGEALVETALLTGEPLPEFRRTGDGVMAGTRVVAGQIQVTVEKSGEATRLAGIIRRVEQAEAVKAPVQMQAERFGEILFPFSMALFGGTWMLTGSLIKAMSMLIITCPCAIRISAAVAVSGAVGNAARKGILIKDGKQLESLGRIHTLVIDKTGTLTDGVPEIVDITVCHSDWHAIDLLRAASAVQRPWQHPLRETVLAAVEKAGLPVPAVTHAEFVSGEGCIGTVDGLTVCAGNARWMQKQGVEKDALDRIDADAGHATGSGCLYVAVNGALAGRIRIADRLRADTRSALVMLRRLGVKRIVVLTGDREAAAARVCTGLPVDSVYWDQSPEAKAEWIDHYKSRYPGRRVAMVGDGANDAPAFAHADLSIAMGDSGSDVAVEYADVVLNRKDFMLLAEAVHLGQRALSIVTQNAGAVVSLNVAAGMLIAMGPVSPVAGALFHNAVTCGAVANSARMFQVTLDEGRVKPETDPDAGWVPETEEKETRRLSSSQRKAVFGQ